MAFAAQFELLDPKLHANKVFDCGHDEMNQFLKRYADKNRNLGLSATWVLPEQDEGQGEQKVKLGAYYTLASSTVKYNPPANPDKKSKQSYSKLVTICKKLEY